MSDEVLQWLREKLADAEKSLKAREQMEACWRGGTDKSWREVGCKMTKSQRLKESSMQQRIAVKCRRECEMFKAIIATFQHLESWQSYAKDMREIIDRQVGEIGLEEPAYDHPEEKQKGEAMKAKGTK